MNCQKCKIEIEERNLRREGLSAAAKAHLSACADCRVFGEERLALSRLMGGLEKVSAPADFDFRMRARMAAEASAKTTRANPFNFSPASLSWPLAACFALVISASFYFQHQRQTGEITGPTEQPRAAHALATPPERASINNEATSPEAASPEVASQSAPAPGVETNQDGAARASRNTLVARQRVTPFAGRVAGRATIDAPQIRAQVEESNSVSVLGSPVKYAGNGAGGGQSALIPVQVGAQEQPLKVLLRETNGGARTISVESVSFGSRDVIGRPATISKVSLSTNQGVW